jgi:lipid II:glycine glycyltransferase (peptidoglycan interpeptide bridge formation enzyme)
MWAATNREFPSYCGGEATQWAGIEWALERKCATYELPGGNPHGMNPNSVYRFKKKLGIRSVELKEREYYPLNIRGAILEKAVARFLDR